MYRNKNDFNDVGLRIYSLMQQADINMDDAAEKIGVSTNHLRKLLRGQHEWKSSYIQSLADYLEVEIEYIQCGMHKGNTNMSSDEVDRILTETIDHIIGLPKEEQNRHLLVLFERLTKLYRN